MKAPPFIMGRNKKLDQDFLMRNFVYRYNDEDEKYVELLYIAYLFLPSPEMDSGLLELSVS